MNKQHCYFPTETSLNRRAKLNFMNTSEEQALEEKLQNPKRVDELSVSTFLRKTFEILEVNFSVLDA